MAAVTLIPYTKEFASSSAEEAPNFHPLVNYSPEASKTSHERWSLVCKTAAITTAVAFLALAVFVSVITAETMPLLALLILVPGLPTSKAMFDHMWTKGKVNDAKAKLATNILAEKEKITDEMLASRVDKLGFDVELEGEKLKNLFARYNYLINTSETMKTAADEAFRKGLPDSFEGMDKDLEGYSVGTTDFTDENAMKALNQKTRMLHEHDSRLSEAALEKFRAITLLKLMQAPSTQDLSDYFQVVTLPYTHRLILEDYGDNTSNVLIKTANEETAYTAREILGNDSVQIAKAVFDIPKQASGYRFW